MSITAEIRNLNLTYLMLAKQALTQDSADAIYHFGIDKQTAELISTLSIDQLIKLASSGMTLARFRFDSSILNTLTKSNNNGSELAQVHAAILMAGQKVEDIPSADHSAPSAASI